MALFKILKGDSSRISTSVTPFHEGYAYFTPDDGGLYIDANGERIRIGMCKHVSATLLASAWDEDGKQVIAVKGLGLQQDGNIGVSSTATDEEHRAAEIALLRVSAQAEGSLTIKVCGFVPTVDIPVDIMIIW